MKKIITTAIIATALLSSQSFAMDTNTISAISVKPVLISEDIKVDNIGNSLKELLKKYEIVLRNNKVESDYKYNSSTYYTSKIKTENLIIPKEVINKVQKIYFLVEEGNDRIYFKNSAIMEEDSIEIEEVQKEYNYKKVAFKQDKKEYIFNNKDLVKNFGNGEYSNVSIKLIAEFSETEKIPLTNSVYVSIGSKINVLNYLQNRQENKYNYFGYYNSEELEEYLEKYSDKLSRSEYKKILRKADYKVKNGLNKNEKVKNYIIKSITKESDFKIYFEKYVIYTETDRLFSTLSRAVRNQLQDIRAFDAIDSILK